MSRPKPLGVVTVWIRRGEQLIPAEVNAYDLSQNMKDQSLIAKHMSQQPGQPVRGLEDTRSFDRLAVESTVRNRPLVKNSIISKRKKSWFRP